MAKHVKFSESECLAFAEAANPHQWVLVAESLHEQAVALYRTRREKGVLVRRSKGQPVAVWDSTNKATFLLGALALENAIKAFLIYEHPQWIGNGFLHSELCSHRLVELSEKSNLLPFKKRDRWVLAEFENGNESWMRYPCGRRANDIQDEKALSDKLWNAYLRAMGGYGTKLMRLLGKGWHGPHGFEARWEMSGEWLGGKQIAAKL